jgi:hypothetical protein
LQLFGKNINGKYYDYYNPFIEMALIARHLKNPDKIFLYQILNKTKDEILLKILRNKNNLRENELYEFIIIDSQGYKYVLGKILEQNIDLVKVKIVKENIKKKEIF